MTTPLPIRQYNRSVNSEIERLLYQNSVIVMDANGLASGVDEAQLNWSEPGSEWSAAQCFEHLNITHRLWLPLMEQAVKDGHERRTLSNGPYAYGFLSRMFLRMVEPPVKMRFKAPGSFRPRASLSADKVVGEFSEHHQRLERIIGDANGLDLARIRVASAFSKHIRYSLGMSFWIIMAHDRRHIWQARQMLLRAG